MAVLVAKCSNKQDVQMPAFPESPNKDNSGTFRSHAVTPFADDDDAKAAPSYHSGDDGEEEEDNDEAWDLKRIVSIQDLHGKSPVKCSTDTCDLLAACVYESTADPTNPWYSCLDCQVRYNVDGGGQKINTPVLQNKDLTVEQLF